jgi:signal transduction histidine kinase
LARSRSLWDFEIETPPGLEDGQARFVILDGPSDQTLSAMVRQIRFRNGNAEAVFVAIVAEDRADLVASITRFGSNLAIALGILGVVLVAAAWLQVELGLRPLQTVRAGIERVRGGKESRLAGSYPSEVQPLIVEVNDLLRSQETSIEFARARASDLAHGLKTPLAVLATMSDKLRDRGDADTAKLVDELTADMVDRVDYQLRLSRLRLRTATHAYSASVNDSLDRTIAVLQRTKAGEELVWDKSIEPGLKADLDPRDLLELVGVVIENAVKWGKSAVGVSARRDGANVEILVEDDGPGISPEQAEILGKRGTRLDETKAGSGLGLAIAIEIVALNKGTIVFGRSGKGGLSVRLSLPLAG